LAGPADGQCDGCQANRCCITLTSRLVAGGRQGGRCVTRLLPPVEFYGLVSCRDASMRPSSPLPDTARKWRGPMGAATEMKILVIADDAETAVFPANGLQENGHVVDLAANGRDGLFLSTSGQYDVAIVDRMLPQLDGLSLVRAMRSAGVHTPVLFLSTMGGIDDRVTGLDAG